MSQLVVSSSVPYPIAVAMMFHVETIVHRIFRLRKLVCFRHVLWRIQVSSWYVLRTTQNGDFVLLPLCVALCWRTGASVYLSVLSKLDARQHSFWGMWCILVCHPHLAIIHCCVAVWAQACGLGCKTSFCSYRSSLGHLAPSLVCRCRWWEQYHDTAISGIDILTFATLTTLVQCVLVNTSQCHDTANLVHDSVDGRST